MRYERQSEHPAQTQGRMRPGASRAPLLPALLLGVGFGGFVDGIGFHEILQWHHILSDEGCCPAKTVAGLEDNTLADGFFHVVTWFFVFAGTIAATRAWQQGRLARHGACTSARCWSAGAPSTSSRG